jgi:REP element-mobilizing transposase RayT
LFNDAADYMEYLDLLKKYKNEHGFKLFAYVLLPKQLHLLIEPLQDSTISTIMHNLNSTYTKVFNSRYGKKGHVFQGRFKAVIIEKDGYLLGLTRHIHLCPQQLKAANDLKKYPYSSYQFYIAAPADFFANAPDDWPDLRKETAEALSYFTQEDKYKAYEDFMSSVSETDWETLQKKLRKPFMGSSDFVKSIKDKIDQLSTEAEQEEGSVSHPNRIFVAAGSFVIIVLSVVVVRLYDKNLGLQNQFEATMTEYSRRLAAMQQVSESIVEDDSKGLDGTSWDITLDVVKGEGPKGPHNDQLRFNNGYLVSQRLSRQGFPPFSYRVENKADGTVVWETEPLQYSGMTASWYGVWSGNNMRGLLSERPVAGNNRDFSFISFKRVLNKGVNHVVQ